ncbi:major facilitator superfamily domain-containing protein [Xylaria bambusicola]|uniref:major facilitator superfamily domain-containing protein n=1 Tax=Xylaria bambusicola TaxID=326684 RepID=UPI002007B2C3|nr:major facilitator superfamily domain-containing protein [Xylaria bambusicola]KAI0521649.1 major facilitator superfamily domain-containing protein [Xylaria bambusicola]
MADISFIRQIRHGWFTADFWLCTILMFLVEFGCAVLGAPSPRLLEIVVCREYYDENGGSLTQRDCKIQEVQMRLGLMLTVLSTCSIFAATLMQIPMGLLADKRGMKVALVLNIISTILYWGWLPLVAVFIHLPTWTLYIAPVFIFIGGGPWASGALIFAAINQRITASQRTPAFSIMEAISGIADLIGPALGTLTMENHISIPFLVATLSFALMFVPTILLQHDPLQLSIEIDDIDSEAEVSRPGDSEEQPLLRSISADSNDSERPFIRSTMAIYGITFGSFFLISLARDSNNFLIPWISWRFNESMARAGLIFSLRAIVSSFVFFVLLPTASSFISRGLKYGSFTRDLIISSSSTLLLCAGAISIAVSSNLSTLVVGFCIMTLGSGATVSLRAFLASKVDRSLSGRLFAATSTTSTIGSLIGMPLMGALYSISISEETVDISLPFAMAAAAYFLVSCVIGSLHLTV